MLEKELEVRLSAFRDPRLVQDLSISKTIKRITVLANRIEVEIVFAYPCASVIPGLTEELGHYLAPWTHGKALDIQLSWKVEPHAGKTGLSALPNVKNIIAVASGKGGVGKSTIAVNLALALAKEGAQVGLLDADIYGPSQPTMLAAEGERPVLKDKKLQPIVRHGIQSMSIGYLVDADAAVVWRGPMLGKAVQQMLHDTNWEALDYLIVDLPPGTGDVQLTLCQKIPVSGAVIVTTPQDLALLDVARACEMFKKLNVPILGVVENMSVYHCPQCGHAATIFGQGGAKKLAQRFGLTTLETIPLNIEIREMTDHGNPPVVQAPDSQYAKAFCTMARQVAANLALLPKDFSSRFPKVVVNPAE